VIITGRPTFNNFFDHFSESNINVIANLDIYFDETIKLVKQIKPNEVYCLTRYEDMITEIITFAARHYGHKGEYSQDAWIFNGIPKINADFCIGQRGCDNHLAYLIRESGMKPLNPSKTIRAIHRHNIDPDASHSRGSRVGNGLYLPLIPTEI
jgi:hypothetical protein